MSVNVTEEVLRQAGKKYYILVNCDDPGEVPVHTGMMHGVQWRAALWRSDQWRSTPSLTSEVSRWWLGERLLPH